METEQNRDLPALSPREREAIRYMGFGRTRPDAATLALLGDVFEKLDRMVRPRSTRIALPLTLEEPQEIHMGDYRVRSKNLYKNLQGCERIWIFGATLGVEVDREIQRTSVTNMARAVVIQAASAAMLEEYCDAIQEEIRREALSEDLYLRPRFSPGYGDFSIFCQGDILRLLNSACAIGLSMTESCMLVPTKSVTAVAGAGREPVHCHRQGCEACTKTDCAFRRDT